MKLVVIVLCILLMIPSFVYNSCVYNEDFAISNQFAQRSKFFLCTSESQCDFRYLKLNYTYHGCFNAKINKTLNMVIKQVYLNKTLVACLVGDIWKPTCEKSTTSKRFTENEINSNIYYAISCGNSFSLTPFEDRDQFAVNEIVQRMFSKQDDAAEFYSVGTRFKCQTFCSDRNVKLKINYLDMGPLTIISDNEIEIFDNYNESVTTAPRQEITCSTNDYTSDKYYFRVGQKYECRNHDSNNVDTGDNMLCSCNMSVPTSRSTRSVTIDKGILLIVEAITEDTEKGPYYSLFQVFRRGEDTKLKEGPLVNKLRLSCVIGNLTNVVGSKKTKYIRTAFKNVTLGLKAQTVMQYLNNKPINFNDITNKAIIKCNDSYYRKLLPNSLISSSPQYLYFDKNSSLEHLSREMFQLDRSNLPNNTKSTISFVKSFEFRVFVFCWVRVDSNSSIFLTRPIEVSSGLRPEVEIFNMYPKQPHNISLSSFTYGCRGINTYMINFECVNCTLDTGQIITESFNKTLMTLTVPDYLQYDVILQYKCLGKSVKYDDVVSNRTFHFVVDSQVYLKKNKEFWLKGDYVGCVAEVRISNKTIFINMSVWLKVDQVIIKPPPGKTEIQIPIKEFYLIQSCCVRYTKYYLTCKSNWVNLPVVGNYSHYWSHNYAKYYPGLKLKCFICIIMVGSTANTCDGDLRLSGKEGWFQRVPDGRFWEKKCKDYKGNLAVPVIPTTSDHKYQYKANNIEFDIICCARNTRFKKRVPMASCNENPPASYILPRVKALFVVNETISCATGFVLCQRGITYVITVQALGKALKQVNGSTYRISEDDIGENVYFKCLAGIPAREVANRTISVFSPPFNLTLKRVNGYMFPGDYLECDVQGFPIPEKTWLQPKGESKLRISGDFLLITQFDFDGVYQASCEAVNKLGKLQTTVIFYLYNMPLSKVDSIVVPSLHFYVSLPLLTFLYIVFTGLCFIIIFQESVFSVPLFSSYKANSLMVDPSKSTDKVTANKPDVELAGNDENEQLPTDIMEKEEGQAAGGAVAGGETGGLSSIDANSEDKL